MSGIQGADYRDIPALTEMFIDSYQTNEAWRSLVCEQAEADRTNYAARYYWQWIMGEWILPRGHIFTNAARSGAIMCLPPNQNDFSDTQQTEFRIHLTRLTGKPDIAQDMVESLHRGTPIPNCWWLVGLGVASRASGHGLATQLIDRVLELADRDNAPCYVVNSDEQLIEVYEKRGFQMQQSDPALHFYYQLRPQQA